MDLNALLARLDAPALGRVVFWILVILVITVVALRFLPELVNGVVDRALRRPEADDTRGRLTVLEFEKRRRTLHALAGNSVRAVVLAIAALAVLGIFEIDLGPAIAGLGLVGLAIGLGAQGLVKDIVAGAFGSSRTSTRRATS